MKDAYKFGEISNRVLKYFEYKKIDAKALYSILKENNENIKVSYESLRKFFKKLMNLKLEKIKYVLSPFNDYNFDWILTGEGEMIKMEGKSIDSNYIKVNDQWQMVEETAQSYNSLVEEKFKPIPYFNVDFAGGWNSEDVFSNVKPDFFINNPEFQRSDFACNLVGKSISAIIPDGAVVGFKIIDDWRTYFPENELYGIITKNEFRTVKLIRRNREKKTLILKPAPSNDYAERFSTEEEIPEDYVIKFFQVISYACFERLVI